MRVLHTADWHIGKVLHKHPLQDELMLFFKWLLITIDTEKVDLLLVSGDIFDLANPSAKDRQLYYGFLQSLVHKNIKIIITGGNHDSVGFLNAPKQLLDELNIRVIGGATDPIEDELIEVYNKLGVLEVVVAAVPFLRDRDLRNAQSDQKYSSRAEAIRAGIRDHYEHLAHICDEQYPDLPVVAMGHLTVAGVEVSESERDIHIGNSGAIDYKAFPERFDYIALGHIHKPQLISSHQYRRYSGSPIALSFSEKEDEKCVVIFDIEQGQVKKPKAVYIPKNRELRKFSGTLETVKSKLRKYDPDFPLISFVELEVIEDEFSSLIVSELEELKSSYQEGKFKVLKGKPTFKKGTRDTSDLFKSGEQIEDLLPIDVFRKRLDMEEITEERKKELTEAFLILIEDVEQAEEV